MTKVFIGGSRKISKLNKKVVQALDKVVEKGLTILVGDASGADKAVQNYLINKKYSNVIVYCMQNICRNNLGDWQSRNVETAINNNGFQFYSLKDSEMAKDANYGLMLWDSKSKGTLNNIVNLLKVNKTVVVYFSPTKKLYALYNYSDLAKLLKWCDKGTLDKFDKDLHIYQLILQSTLWSHDENNVK